MHQCDYEHKKVISTNSGLHWSNNKNYAKLSSRKCVKKCNNYSTKLPSDKNLKEMRQTLNNILPKENKRASGGDSSNLSATKFNEFFCINRMEFMQCLKRPSLFSNFSSQS